MKELSILLNSNDLLFGTIFIFLPFLYRLLLKHKYVIKFLEKIGIYRNPSALSFCGGLLVLLCGLGLIAIASVILNHPIRTVFYSGVGAIYLLSIVFSIYTEINLTSSLLAKVDTLLLNRLDLFDSKMKYNFITIADFNQKELLEKIKQSHKCDYIVLYSLNFFSIYREEICVAVENKTEINFLITNQNSSSALSCMEAIFERKQKDEIKKRISSSIELICNNICKNGKNKSKVRLKIIDRVLPYSLYIFDDEEMWFCPRHAAKGKKDTLVFIFKGDFKEKNNLFYKDAKYLLEENDTDITDCCKTCKNGQNS